MQAHACKSVACHWFAHYPETVTITALYASPHWRSLALAQRPGFGQFIDEFNNRLQVELVPRFDGGMWFVHALRDTADGIKRSLVSTVT